MSYLNHQNEFGVEFDSKLKELEKLIQEIYEVRHKNDLLYQDDFIRLHSSTLDANSSFACINAILENKITMGSIVNEYENNYKKYIGNTHEVLSCNSGSSANLLAISTLYQAGKLKSGDKVVVPALSWSTTVFPLVQYGLVPVFCDCNDIDFNISIENLESLVNSYKPKALMLIHTYGCPANMTEIVKICEGNAMVLIEDTCESMGSEWDGKKAGTFGDVSTFSSYYSHHICTLEGGLTCFKDKTDFKIANSVRSHGWTRHLDKEEKIFKEYPTIDPGFLFNFVGYNLRLSEPQAAIGIQQLKQLDIYIKKRIKSAKTYSSFFKTYKDLFKYIKPNEKALSSWFGFPLVLEGKLKGKRNKLREMLFENNIESRPFLAGDFTLQPVVKKFEYHKDEKLKVSNSIATDGLAIPCHQDINNKDIEKITSLIEKFIEINY